MGCCIIINLSDENYGFRVLYFFLHGFGNPLDMQGEN